MGRRRRKTGRGGGWAGQYSHGSHASSVRGDDDDDDDGNDKPWALPLPTETVAGESWAYSYSYPLFFVFFVKSYHKIVVCTRVKKSN